MATKLSSGKKRAVLALFIAHHLIEEKEKDKDEERITDLSQGDIYRGNKRLKVFSEKAKEIIERYHGAITQEEALRHSNRVIKAISSQLKAGEAYSPVRLATEILWAAFVERGIGDEEFSYFTNPNHYYPIHDTLNLTNEIDQTRHYQLAQRAVLEIA